MQRLSQWRPKTFLGQLRWYSALRSPLGLRSTQDQPGTLGSSIQLLGVGCRWNIQELQPAHNLDQRVFGLHEGVRQIVIEDQ